MSLDFSNDKMNLKLPVENENNYKAFINNSTPVYLNLYNDDEARKNTSLVSDDWMITTFEFVAAQFLGDLRTKEFSMKWHGGD